MRTFASALVVAGFALAASISSASAGVSLSIHFPGELVRIGDLWCPPGTHPGYEDKHCWSNHGALCPPGFHPGYEDKYCWRNK